MRTFDSAEAAAFNAMTSVYVFDDPVFPSMDFARRFLADLGANGYVVVPRHLLDELLWAARYTSNALRLPASAPVGFGDYELAKSLGSAADAVVEAVGANPTGYEVTNSAIPPPSPCLGSINVLLVREDFEGPTSHPFPCLKRDGHDVHLAHVEWTDADD